MVSRVNIVGYDCGVEYDPDGYYVKYADYAALEARLAALEDRPRDTNTVVSHEAANVRDKPEGRQEAVRIGDAVLDWMVKFDLLDAGNEYCVSDVLAVLNDLTPSTRPSEQAVTEAMVEAGAKAIVACRFEDEGEPVTDYDLELSRAALKAAMEAGR